MTASGPYGADAGRTPSPEPHQYQWLGNAWRCLHCDVQIRNQDCPHNEALAEQARIWTPVAPDA